VRRLSGPIHLHTYIVGKSSDAGHTVWLQANSHHRTEKRAHGRFVVEAPIRDTTFAVECARPPKVTVTPREALVSHEVADAGRRRTLRLSHAQGAVEVTIHCPPRKQPDFNAVAPEQQSDFCRSLEPCGRILTLDGWDTWGCSPIDGPDSRTHVSLEDGKFHMICTDNHGRFMRQGGLHLISDDGIHWPICKQGYQPGHYYDMPDWYGYLGRPQILMRA